MKNYTLDTYEAGVRWISLNDEPTILEPEYMENLISVQLLADLADCDPIIVAADIVEYRHRFGDR